MKGQTNPQSIEQTQNPKIIWAVIISIVVGALIAGSSIYLWQQSNLKPTEQKTQQQITSLQDQIKLLQEENKNLQKTNIPTNAPDKIKFPVVVYGRPGLLNNTESGKIEKKKLEEKLINPYTDYYNENVVNLIALYITVPQNIGEEYDVVAIFGSEKQYGTEQFSFGKREQEYGYWKPDCMGPCKFSESFKKKYPEIVE